MVFPLISHFSVSKKQERHKRERDMPSRKNVVILMAEHLCSDEVLVWLKVGTFFTDSYGLNCAPPIKKNSHVKVLTPSISECGLIWK